MILALLLSAFLVNTGTSSLYLLSGLLLCASFLQC